MSEKDDFIGAALLMGLFTARTDAEREALIVAASRVSAGKSSNDCTDGLKHVALDRGDQCLLCGKVIR